LRDHEDEFTNRNVKIAVVTFENDFFARGYVAETSLAWPLLVDNTRITYRKYGMFSASFWDVWGPKSWWAYLKEVLKGKNYGSRKGTFTSGAGMSSSIRTESFPCTMSASARRIVPPSKR
jgi:hypothetical protein